MLYIVSLIHTDAFGRDIFACLWFWHLLWGDVMLLGILRDLDLGFKICSSATISIYSGSGCLLLLKVLAHVCCRLSFCPLYGHLFWPDPCMVSSPGCTAGLCGGALKLGNLWSSGPSALSPSFPATSTSADFQLCSTGPGNEQATWKELEVLFAYCVLGELFSSARCLCQKAAPFYTLPAVLGP